MHSSSNRRQRGATLLESLVAMLVLAVGVLAILWVQVRTLAETQTAVRRAQAVRAIEDLAERIKSNPGAYAQLGAYVTDWDAAAAPPTDDCSKAIACTPAQLAAYDIRQWQADIARRLPLGKAKVFLSSDEDDDNKRHLGVMVGWRSNERTDDIAYTTPLMKLTSTGTTGATCPTGLICHLAYVQP